MIRGCLDVRKSHVWFAVELISNGAQDMRDVYEDRFCEIEVYGDLQTNGGKHTD